MNGIISFGTIINWKAYRYIYLAQIGQITYLARIIEDERLKTDFLEQYNRVEKAATGGKFRSQASLANTIYSFVILSTADFEGDIAWLHKLGNDAASVDAIARYSMLNEEDSVKLKKQIIENDGISRELRDYVVTLN